MNFKKYSEIENSYRQKYLDYIQEQGLSGGNWIVENKVHGSNFSFVIDDDGIKIAKRTGILEDNENFYGCQVIRLMYEQKVQDLYDYLKEQKHCSSIVVFGEIFGGSYPHPDVPKAQNSITVQSGVWYKNSNDFYAFDIFVDNEYLDIEERNLLLEKFGFFYAKPLFVGTLQECLAYPNNFEDPISGWLGLPSISNNTTEGVVIKPLYTKRFSSGERVALKNKNPKFRENTSKTPRIKADVVLSENGQKFFDILQSLINDNRLHNVISHISQILTQKDFGIIMGEFSKDLWEEFNKDNREEWEKLGKDEQKKITKLTAKITADMIRQHFLNILDGNF